MGTGKKALLVITYQTKPWAGDEVVRNLPSVTSPREEMHIDSELRMDFCLMLWMKEIPEFIVKRDALRNT